MRLKIHRGAKAELNSAARRYNKERDGLGDELVAAINTKVKLILELPETWPRIGECRAILLRRFKFRVVYRRVGEELIQIVAFAHTSREHMYWRNRR
jgi:hypothetical protein